ncbi:hypothetical protein U8527_01055 [Kordia algicida OT-1]|uniref:hypothetical protein n=1 Tax=Kordia algicida TaxID=221066 RepID=UPI0012FB5A2B|nr:hypothetical protein [Kordia algicida]
MKKRNLKKLSLDKKVISSLKTEIIKGKFRRGSDNPDCSGDTAIVYTCHETCHQQER